MISETYKTIFKKFNVTEEDKKRYLGIIKNAESFDDIEKVINDFMKKYVSQMNKKFTNLVLDILNVSLSTELMNRELANAQNIFILSSTVFEQVAKANFKLVSEMVVSKTISFIGGDKKLEKLLADKLMNEFENRISGAMANTRADVLQSIRTLQREMIIRNKQLALMKNSGVIDSIIEKEKLLFRENLLKKYPQLKKMLEEGDILKSRAWVDKDGNQRFRTYTLDEYNEMATSETLKNVDRDAVEMISKYYNEPVVEFYLRDTRNVENPNQACAHIMNKKLFGKSLLATSESVAAVLGIWSIDKAKAQHSLNISYHCRHSIRRADDEIINKVNKIINVYKMSEVS